MDMIVDPPPWPAQQHMISHMTANEVEQHFKRSTRHYEATNHDVQIQELKPTQSFDSRKGLKSRYTLRWRTYTGWRVYMLMTGCYASMPRYEEKQPA